MSKLLKLLTGNPDRIAHSSSKIQKYINSGWLSLFLWLVFLTPAQAAIALRVAIKNSVNQVSVGSSTTAIVRDGAGRAVAEMVPGEGIDAYLNAGKVTLGQWKAGQISIEPTGGGYVWIGDRWYRGQARLIPSKKGLIAVNYVDLEEYLYSVLGAEMNGNWPQEALKAQAVAARSYALHKRQTSRNGIYDLGDTQTSQVYKGVNTESEGTRQAVIATTNQVLAYRGQIILALFHSSSGGHTENVEDVWSGKQPYLRGVQDYDQGTPQYQWVKEFSRNELSKRLGLTDIQYMIPERTSRYGSIMSMKIVGNGRSRRLTGAQLRQVLGLKSTRFTVSATPTTFQINGRGFGHGVGMSQWGAYQLALQGVNYQQILSHYYQGTTLTTFKVN